MVTSTFMPATTIIKHYIFKTKKKHHSASASMSIDNNEQKYKNKII